MQLLSVRDFFLCMHDVSMKLWRYSRKSRVCTLHILHTDFVLASPMYMNNRYSVYLAIVNNRLKREENESNYFSALV